MCTRGIAGVASGLRFTDMTHSEVNFVGLCFIKVSKENQKEDPLFILYPNKIDNGAFLHVGVNIKNNVEKDTTCYCSFSLKVRAAILFPAKNTSSCL